jgi:hypothetical protein
VKRISLVESGRPGLICEWVPDSGIPGSALRFEGDRLVLTD